MMRSLDMIPGIPSAGHVSTAGYWHPGATTTCSRCADPIEVACPNCQARPGRPCTQPTNDSRRPVSWFHLARGQAASR